MNTVSVTALYRASHGAEMASVDAADSALHHWRQLITDSKLADARAWQAKLEPLLLTPAHQLRQRALELLHNMAEAPLASAEMLRQARLLGQQAEAMGDPAASADCRFTEAICYRNARLYAESLQCIERARSIYDYLHEPALALAMQVQQANIYYSAGMYERLTVFGEALIPQTEAMRPQDRHALMSCVASAYFYLLESEWQQGLQDRCVALNELALSTALAHGMASAACLSHMNLALNDAAAGRIASARLHLNQACTSVDQRSMRNRLQFAQPFIEAICLFHEGQFDAAFDGMDLAAARAGDTLVARHLNNILNTKVKLARQAGRPDVALAAARRLQALDQAMSEDHIRLLVSDFATHAEIARVHADHEALLRHGDALERSLAARNLELSSALARVQSEIGLRRATEGALRSTQDDLEHKAQARAQSVQEAKRLLARQAKLAALGNVGAGLAHELNTPIGNARLVASALHEKSTQLQAQISEGKVMRTSLDTLAQEVDGGAQLLQQALLRLQQLVHQLQGTPEDTMTPPPVAFDAIPLAHRVVLQMQGAAHECGVELALQGPEQCACLGDPSAFVDVMHGLIDNALRHGLEGRVGGVVKIKLRQDAEHVEMVVADNGRGIHAAHASRVFEPFFTTRFGQGSSGLGLHRVQQWVQQRLHGEITLSAGPGSLGGAEFVLRLPLAIEEPAVNV